MYIVFRYSGRYEYRYIAGIFGDLDFVHLGNNQGGAVRMQPERQRIRLSKGYINTGILQRGPKDHLTVMRILIRKYIVYSV